MSKRNNASPEQPAYVERVITGDEMARRQDRHKQATAHDSMFSVVRGCLALILLFAVAGTGLHLFVEGSIGEDTTNTILTFTMYGSWLLAAVAMIFGFNAASVASKLDLKSFARKDIGLALLAVIFAAAYTVFVYVQTGSVI